MGDSAPDSESDSGPPTPAELAEIVNEDAPDIRPRAGSAYPSRRSSLSDTLYIDMTTLSLTSTLVFGDSRRGSLFVSEEQHHLDEKDDKNKYDVSAAKGYVW